ncbi:MAG: putative MPP superfamily phosphohydrolase [Hyphomicrobiaceae bacterium]
MKWFWGNFFGLVIVVTGVAQWLCIAWLLIVAGGVAVPWWAHFVAPAIFSRVNRLLVRAPVTAGGISRSVRRAYTAVVFASLFGMLALAATGALWGTAHFGLEIANAAGLAVDPGRAGAAAKPFGTLALVMTLGAIGHGYTGGQRRVNVEKLRVSVRGRMKPLSVIQISDLHLGQYMDGEAIAAHVRRINALEPDLICITGDITDGLEHAPETFAALGGLKASLGVLCILGNHDFYTGADDVEAALARYTDFTLLRDARTVIDTGSGPLHVIGLDDRGETWARGLAQDRVLDELYGPIPAHEPVLLLTHRPDLFEHAAKLSVDITLAGHTHGGQLALPWPGRRPLTLARFMTRFPRGTYRSGTSTLHVNLGLGVTGQPVRVASPREITLLTLVGKGEHECVSPAC